MPNWCANNLYVSGDFTRFNEWMGDVFSFNKILPMPEELKDSEPFNDKHAKRNEFKEKYGAYDWYDWRVQNWGTKWDIYEVDIQHYDPTLITLCFQTAWSPPQMVIGSLAAKFPELKFKLAYLEEGCGFVGYSIWENGEYQTGEHEDDSSTDAWKKIAIDEFSWEEEVEEES